MVYKLRGIDNRSKRSLDNYIRLCRRCKLFFLTPCKHGKICNKCNKHTTEDIINDY